MKQRFPSKRVSNRGNNNKQSHHPIPHKAEYVQNTSRPRIPLVLSLFVLFSFVLVAIVWIYWRPQRQTLPAPAESGLTEDTFFYGNDYPGAHELWEMLQKKDAGIDLARANFLIAQAVCPVTEEHYRMMDKILTEAERVVRTDAEEALKHITDPDEKWTSDAQFMALCSVIQRRAPEYNPAFQTTDLSPEKQRSMLSDPANMFLHGLLLEKKGTCANMPLFYLVVGQRLDWPVHGVTIGHHLFVRWDSPSYRINFEPTITTTVAMTADDSVYKDIEGISPEMLVNSSWLRSLNRHEMIGQFFNSRAGYYLVHEKLENAYADLVRAKALCPDDPGIAFNLRTCTATRRDRNLQMILNHETDPDFREAFTNMLQASQLGQRPYLPPENH